MSLRNAEVNVGDRVHLVRGSTLIQAGPSGRRWDFTAQEQFVVTRVYNDSLLIRTVLPKTYGQAYQAVTQQVSFSVGRAYLELSDPNAPGPRKLGQKPDDTADMTYIGTDHPGIQWLWEDLHTYANGKGWCDEFDRLAREVNIPGRMEEFEIEVSIPGGGTYVTDVRAHSEEEAERLAREELMRGVQEMNREGQEQS